MPKVLVITQYGADLLQDREVGGRGNLGGDYGALSQNVHKLVLMLEHHSCSGLSGINW